MQKQPDGRNELRTVDDVLMIYPVLNVRNDRTRVDRETGSCPAMRRTVRWAGVEPLGERLGGGLWWWWRCTHATTRVMAAGAEELTASSKAGGGAVE